MRNFNDNMDSANVLVNDINNYCFNIIRGRNYFGGVTTFMRDFGLLSEDGVIKPKNCKWFFDSENTIVKLYLE